MADRRSRCLDRRDDQPVVDQLDFDPVCRRRERRIEAAALSTALETVGYRFSGASSHSRAALDYASAAKEVDDHRQGAVADRDPFRGILGLVPRVWPAMTNATGSPTCRTRWRAKAGRGGTIIGATVATWAMHGSAPIPVCIKIGSR